MVFRGAELEYDNNYFELLSEVQKSNVINVAQRSKTTGNITMSCNTTLCFFWAKNSIEAYFLTLEVNMRLRSWSFGYLRLYKEQKDAHF